MNGSKIPFPLNSQKGSLPIRLVDGSRPFNIFVNGQLLRTNSLSRIMSWEPTTPGFYSVVAIDKKGQVTQSKFELAPVLQ